MFCSKCGAQIDEKASVCVHCGQSVTVQKTQKDTGGALWWWVGFLVPIAGLLIFVLCHDSTPKRAKKAGWGALISTIVSAVLVVLFYVLYFVFFFYMFSEFPDVAYSFI